MFTIYKQRSIAYFLKFCPHVVSASIIPEDIINTDNVDEKFFILALYGVILATIGIILILGFLYYSNKQGCPEINNCPTLTSQEIVTEIQANKSGFCTELGKYLKPLGPALKSYTGFLSLFCFISFGYAIGQVYLMNIPQIICTFGYSKIMQSYVSICTILASGVATSLVASWISWKWKAEVATTKVLCALALVGIWGLAFVGTTDGMDGLLIGVFVLIGGSILPCLPLSHELAVECTYPMGAGLVAGTLSIGSNFLAIFNSVIFIVAGQVVEPGQDSSTDFDPYMNNTCNVQEGDDDSKIKNYRFSMIIIGSILTVLLLNFIVVFKCPFKRRLADLK